MRWYLGRVALLGVLRHGRWSAALVLAIAFAACAFTVLASNARANQVVLSGPAAAAPGAAYDILVRPRDAGRNIPGGAGLLAPNFTVGQIGGISMGQYHTIARLPGVAVAAPIALIGQVLQTADIAIPLTGVLTSAPQQLFVASVTRVTDQGLSSVTNRAADYSYVTDEPLVRDGSHDGDAPVLTQQVNRDGSLTPVCSVPAPSAVRAQAASQLSHLGSCWSTASARTRPELIIPWTFTSVLAAIDPVAEARLAGLNHAVTQDHYLAEAGAPAPGTIPVLVANQSAVDDTDLVAVRRMPAAAARQVGSGLPGPALGQVLSGGGQTVRRLTITAADAYGALLAAELSHRVETVVNAYFSAGPVAYATTRDGVLRARAAAPSWADATASVPVGPDPVPDPPDAADSGVRSITAHVAADVRTGPRGGPPRLVAVGAYAQARPAAAMSTMLLPLEMYRIAPLFGANAASTKALGGSQLLPNANPAGYLTGTPTLLTSLAYLPELTSPSAFTGGDEAAPITTIRVRVAGAAGDSALARARIRAVANLIAARTGLDVSVISAADLVSRQVVLPAGRHGRPALVLASTWVRPLAGLAVSRALDQGGLAFFGLVLIVCAMFAANSTLASLDARRDELELLYLSGWSRGRVGGLLLAETALLGIPAGVLAMAVAMPVGAILGLPVTVGQSAWSVPVAAALAVTATSVPAWQACQPARLRRLPSRRTARGVRLSAGGVGALAAGNILRSPVRNALAFAAVTLSAAAVTCIAIVQSAFGGSLTGELAGHVVSLQLRTADIVAVGGVLVLLAGLMTDLARLAVSGRRAELALLRELGWDYGLRNRLIHSEMLLITASGAALGAGFSAAGVITAASSAPWPVWPAMSGGALLTGAVAALAAGLPVQLHRDPVIRAHR